MERSHQDRHRREDPVRAAARRKRHLLILAAAVLLTFVSALPGGLVWTDHLDLTQAGARVVGWQDMPDAFRLSANQLRESRLGATPDNTGGAWRPMAVIGNSLAWWLTDGCASCLHAISLALHTLTVIGLYAIGRRLLARRSHGKTLAFWAALLFAVHPLTTIPVAFLGRLDLLIAVALTTLALVTFTRLPATSGSAAHGRWRWLLPLAPLTLTAMLSHESALVLPLLAVLLAWHEMRERGRRGFTAIGPARRVGLLLMLLTTAAYLALRMHWVGLTPGAHWPGQTTGQTLAIGLDLFWHGLWQVAWPGEPVISDAWPVPPGFGPNATAGLLGLVFMIGITAWGLRRRHPAAVGITWFLLWYLPQSGVIPLLRLHDDSRLYPAAWGLLIGLVLLAYRLWRPLGRQLVRSAEVLAFTPFVVLLALLTALSTLRFRDDIALFTGEINEDPYYLEGRVMLGEAALRAGQPLLALNQGILALESLTKDTRPAAHWPAADAHTVLGQAQLALGLLPDALGNLRAARSLAPHRAAPWYGVGRIHLMQGDLDDALAELENAHRLTPGDVAIRLRLGEALLRVGQYDKGMAMLIPLVNRGLADEPALVALTEAFSAQGNPQAAIAHLRLALSLHDDPALRARLARLLWRHGQREAAQDEITRALERASDDRLVREVAAEITAGFPTLPRSF